MESDLGKLFVGGISWDTDEERLREYFTNYGEVIEAVIMRDRTTGRARGFGFVVFADPVVAERVIMDKHMIDGRTVEAKRAVPRDDQHLPNRTTSGMQGSPALGRTRKIFVGGLASTVTESDFKKYFDQFGTITDVVVMYDHNTQRPRGFGFITFDAEDAVDKVLQKTFHELNGKMVEVKRAVPKELSPPSPGPTHNSPMIGYNYGMSRANLLNNYAQGYNGNSLGGFGVRMDGRLTPFGNASYGIGMNMEPALSPSYGGNSNFGNTIGYRRMLNPYISGNSNRFNNNTPIGYNGGTGRNDSVLNSPNRNVWGNGGLINDPNTTFGSGTGNFGVSYGNDTANWSHSFGAGQGGGRSSGVNMNYVGGDNNYGLGGGVYGRNSDTSVAPTSPFLASSGGFAEGSYGDFCRGGSVYGDSPWRSELDGSGPFAYGLRDEDSDVTAKSSEGYVGIYNAPSRQSNRGIAA